MNLSAARTASQPVTPSDASNPRAHSAGPQPSPTRYTVADYLMDRLVELGVDRMFGVPGDFTLALLDHVVEHPGLSWTGCANELNAGYAADGYGRMRGIAAFTTTFGVGELSALNAIAGSYAEHVPVVEIVGAPATTAQAAARIVHHSLGDGVFDHFLEIHRKVTCARAALTVATATDEIDRVLTTVRDLGLPGYLLLPTDVAAAPAMPPSAPLPPRVDATDPAALAAFREAAGRLVDDLTDPQRMTVLGGVMVHRTGGVAAFTDLVAAGNLPHATSLWGKSVVDESNPRYVGSYVGAASTDDVRTTVEDADVLVVAGVQFTDLNSGFFTQQLDRDRTIELTPLAASVGHALYSPVSLPHALQALTDVVRERTDPALDHTLDHTLGGPAKVQASAITAPASTRPPVDPGTTLGPGTPLDQTSLWEAVAAYLRPGDIVLADQGTSFYGMATQRLPRGVTFLGQPLWASIGYTLPALLGACQAAPGRRGVLLIGDGAAQMTVQELATIARHQLDVLVVVVDNAGYTVERAIHGPRAEYNDIAQLDWARLPEVLGAPTPGQRVTTDGELAEVLSAAQPRPRGLQLVQAVVGPDDVPPLLATLARQVATANARPR